MPDWLDFSSFNTFTLLVFGAVAFAFLMLGGDWLADGLSNLALALKYEPLFVGLVLTAALGVVPQAAFIVALAQADLKDAALGGLLGGCWVSVLIPIGYAGLKYSIPFRERWVQWDLPLFITYLIVFTFFCLDGGLTRSEGAGLLMLGVSYLFFRYQFGRESRYGLTAFGGAFSFGVSTFSTLYRTLMGIVIMLGASLFLSLLLSYFITQHQLPQLPTGMLSMLPFCLPELAFAFASLRRGHGELIIGQGLGLATLLLLAGGGLLGLIGLPIPSDSVNFAHLSLILTSVLLWGFLRTSGRLWRWQAAMLLLACVAALAITWAQSYGHLLFLQLPKEFSI